MPLIPYEHIHELKAQLQSHDSVKILYVADDADEELVVNDISYDSELDCVVIEVY